MTAATPPAPLALVGLALAALAAPLAAQGSAADYERAARFDERTRGKVFRDHVDPRWLTGGERFWYRVEVGPERHEFVLVDAARGLRQPAFDHARLAAALARASGREVEPGRLPFRTIRPGPDETDLRFSAFDQRWRCDLGAYTLEQVGTGAGDEDALEARARPYPSRRTGDETSLRFVNRTDGEARLFWIDGSGARHAYGALAPGAERDQHTFAGHVWLVTDADGRELAVYEAVDEPSTALIAEDLPRSEPRRERPSRGRRDDTSPDGRWRAEIRGDDVVLRDTTSGEEHALTSDGSAGDAYRGRFWWSPDSSRLVVLQVEPGQRRPVHMVESSPPDQVQPRLVTIDYAKPGDRIDHPRPRLFELETRSAIPVDDALFPEPWSLSELRWEDDSSAFRFLYNQRGHQVLRLVEVDAATGTARAVIDERSPTFVDYAHKRFLHRVAGTDELLWMSERSGWNHLYRIDSATGEVLNAVTSGEWVVRGVERVDDEAGQVWFTAGGIVPGQDPYYLHLCRVGLDGTGLTVLTEGDGTHEWSFSPDGRYLVDRWSRVDLPPVTALRRADDGSLVCELERADWSALLETGWRPAERFVAKGRDGVTDIHGILVRPMELEPGRRYPVIEQIYAGPQGAFVPKAFTRHVGLSQQAELGFVVVQIDGMGTNWRSKAFHDVCWRNLGDAGFPDRIAWLRAAAARYPELDLERVGIHGGSAGGQNALGGLLFHPAFYKAAVADCGCHDNRMDKVWWNEAWMGYPVGEHYAASSNVENAHRLEGALLLMVGELDRNVDPASTMQVVDALIRADKDFELVVFPGAGHGAGGSRYGTRRRNDFFVRHLLGVEPRHAP